MAKRLFPVAVAVILAVVFAAGSAPAQRVDELQRLQGDVLTLQGLIKDLQRSNDLRLQNLQTLLERVVDRVNLMGSDIQTLQSGAQNNAQSNQSNIDKIARMLEETRAQNDRSNRELTTALQTLNTELTATNNRLGEKLAGTLNERTDKLGKEMGQNVREMQLQIDALGKQIMKLAEQQGSTPLPSPEELLRESYADFAIGLYDLALEGFNEIVTKYPNHPVAARAELFRGQTYFEQGKWDQAILAYDSVLQKYKDQDSKRTALYKKGLSQANQKQTTPATETFKQVMADYPETPEAINAAEQVRKLTPPPATPPARGTAPATPARGAAAPKAGG